MPAGKSKQEFVRWESQSGEYLIQTGNSSQSHRDRQYSGCKPNLARSASGESSIEFTVMTVDGSVIKNVTREAVRNVQVNVPSIFRSDLLKL